MAFDHATRGQSPFDLALEAASPKEKIRLREIRLRLNIPADGPEWGMYLLLVAPILALGSQLQENSEAASVETVRGMNESLAKSAAVVGGFEQSFTRTVRTEVASALKTVRANAVDPKHERWRWPLMVAALAGGLLLLALGSFSGAVAQRTLDTARGALASGAGGHVSWLTSAQETIATWPVFPFVVTTAVLLVLTIALGMRKSGPAYRKIFP